MKRDFELVFLIFNVLIETEDNHVTSREKLDEALSNYDKTAIEYHLSLMSGQKWINIFSDGVMMTWEGHDFYDKEFVGHDGNVEENKPPVEFKQD